MASCDFKPGKKRWAGALLSEVMQIWTSQSEEEAEDEEERKTIWLPGSVLSRCFLAPLGVLFVMKTLKDERKGVIMAYKLAVLEFWEICLY